VQAADASGGWPFNEEAMDEGRKPGVPLTSAPSVHSGML